MTRIKVLLLVAVMTAMLLLSGCELFHNHKYVWVNGDDPETARQECVICGSVLDRDSLYVDSIQIISSNNSSFTVSPLIPYEIAVNAGKYGYDEEFNITLTLKLDECRYYEDGPFCVKLVESEYYEILSEKEYVIPNFNVEKADELKSMTYHFTVKAIDRCNLVEHFDFKIKFVPNIFFEQDYQYWMDTSWYTSPKDNAFYCDLSEDYFYTIKALGYMSDSQGIILGESEAELFYDSINREYLAGEIDRDVYIDRVTEYTTNDKVSISYDGGEEYRHFYYESKNLRAKFVVKDEDDYLYSLYLKNTNDDKLTLANILLSSLINGNYITQNQYDSELAYLSSKGLTNEIDREIKRFIPFEEYYKEAYWDYVYYDNIAKSESSCFDNETNYCRMYLSDDMIEVGGEVDVSIYTEFSDTIQEGTRYLSYFLQYLKNF